MKKLYVYLAVVLAAFTSMAARADYVVPPYISGAITDAGAGFTAIFALVVTGIMAVILAKGGFRMVSSWISKFFSGR